jgi:hypothetical protein
MSLIVDLRKDYYSLKSRIGKIPMMVDFFEHGGRDPQLFVNYSGSYFNFVMEIEESLRGLLNQKENKLLELFAKEINNSKRVEESIILKSLINSNELSILELTSIITSQFGYKISNSTILSCINNINFNFVTERQNSKLLPVGEIYELKAIILEDNNLKLDISFSKLLENKIFKEFLVDNIEYSIRTFQKLFSRDKFYDGFVLYRKYSRKDVFRILNWSTNPLAQNVGGYIISNDKTNCPIFVNYHKEEDISSSTKYEDGFISKSEFGWMSKSKRTLKSPDVQTIKNYKNGLRLPLFIKKNNDEGTEFYYMGDLTPIDNSFSQTTMIDDHGKDVSVVKIHFSMNHPVEDGIYEYLTTTIDDVKEEKENTAEHSTKEKMSLKILSLDAVVPFTNCIPLYTLDAAAGDFKIHDNIEEVKWVTLNEDFKYSKDYFVFQVNGESMNKIIPNGSYCLFKNDPGGSRNGKIVLVKSREINDTEMGSGYTVKLYESVKKESGEIWEHETIILKPRSTDPKYKDIVLTIDEETPVEIRGIFVKVLK